MAAYNLKPRARRRTTTATACNEAEAGSFQTVIVYLLQLPRQEQLSTLAESPLLSVMTVSSGRQRNRTGRWLMPIPGLT